jgi:hypothetical protein
MAAARGDQDHVGAVGEVAERRLPPLAALPPVWVSTTVGALNVLFTLPPVARIRSGSTLLPMLTRYQVTGR